LSTLVLDEVAVEAPEALAALQDALSGRRARKPRILDLHLVPEIPLPTAATAFSCLEPRFPAAWHQQVRQLRNRMTRFDQDAKDGGQAAIQVVTLLSLDSARSRKGLAGNLAFSLAAMEETKVLLVDAKVSRPDLNLHLGMGDAAGLCEAAHARREDLPDCFRRISGTQLYMLPFGRGARNQDEAVDLRGLQRLLRELRQQFDWIVVDGPAFDTPADATLVALCSDASLYLVEQGVDRFEDLRAALKQAQGRYMLGAVLI